MSHRVVLHAAKISSASARVRIALALKGIDFELRAVDLRKQENRTDEYRALNPMGQVPTLEIDGVRITQSIAICEYLEDTRPEPPLLPADPLARAQCRELVEIVNAGIQPLQNMGVLGKIMADYGDARLREVFERAPKPEGAGDNWPQHWIRKGLTAFEAKVSPTAGRYCIGDAITLADVVLFAQLTGTRRVFAVPLEGFPTLARIDAALAEHPAFAEVRGGKAG